MAGKSKAAGRPATEIAEELIELAGAQSGAFAHRVARLAAELKGEALPPTPNEVRAAERAAAREAEVDGAAAP